MKRLTLLILVFQFLLGGCALFVEHKVIGNWHEVEELKGCQVRYEMWRWDSKPRKFDNAYSRGTSSINIAKNIVSKGDVYLDSKNKKNSTVIHYFSNLHPIYIGPWQKITLTHKTGIFPFRKTHKEEKQIRFFAYYPKEGGDIEYQYESLNPENKSIPEKPFSLSVNAKIAPDRFGLCVVKWTAKFGYNAIAEVKSKNPFSKNYLVPTGRVIQVGE